MSDDWRLTLELADDGGGLSIIDSIRELALERDAQARLGGKVAVSADGPNVFFYTETESAAREAEAVVNSLMHKRGLNGQFRLERWHPDAEEWRDAAEPLPATAEEHAAEQERATAREAADSAEEGFAEWEVLVELPGHRETRELADRLAAEGLRVVRRWRFLVLGAPTEVDARTLADRIRAEAPDANVDVSLSPAELAQALPSRPFAIFGGLGV